MLIWESFFKSSNLDNVSNGNDAISTMNKEYKFKYVFPLIGKDFIKMIFGLSVSVGIVLAIHYIIIPNNWF